MAGKIAGPRCCCYRNPRVEFGASTLEGKRMGKLLGFLGMTVGGWVGWALGAPISIFTAFILSMVGTGLGLWAAQRFTRNYF